MAGADDSDHLHRGQRRYGDARVAEMFAGDDAQRVAASQQRVDRAAQRQHGHAGGDGRVGGTQGVQRSTDRGDREQRIHDYRQLKLDAFAQALRPGAQGVHAQQDVSGVGQQRLALRGHDGPAAAAVEQRHAQLVFQLAYRDGQRRLADETGLGRPAEMPFARDGDDVLEFGESHGGLRPRGLRAGLAAGA
ncbi:hypothetical protein G6F31_017620 [Rhizopus arrhizus]|nr:hypothetical protein G6F31_017620 [Rhizopus arrhizus]